ncbi:MAG TPA: GNAT family N-acetyltransferase [Chitinophagaceae bacterium]|nr:GNAT family N-acetyltransferase [Chitinophagaceae bacterium]
MDIHWKIAAFESLPPEEIYALLRLRSEVFVVEQQCVFLDQDGLDSQAMHLMGWNQGELAAYARIFNRGLVSPLASIGRVVVPKNLRRSGIGKLLMAQAIQTLYELYGKQPIYIGAQQYLEGFYGSFGFAQAGEPYLEDGISHLKMILP